MPKFSPILSVTALCLAIAACQPADQSASKIAPVAKSAPVNTSQTAEQTNYRAPKTLVLPMINAGNLPEALRSAERAFASARYEDATGQKPAAFEWYLAISQFDANNSQAQTGLKNTVDALIQIMRQTMLAGNLNEAQRLLEVIELSQVADSQIEGLKIQLSRAKKAETLQQKGMALEIAKNILASSANEQGDYAVEAYRAALKAFPGYEPALMAIDRLRGQRERAALILARQNKFAAALVSLKQAERIDGKNPQYLAVSSQVLGRLDQNIQEPIVLANLALDGLRIEPAQAYYQQAKKILPTHSGVIALAKRMDEVKHYGRFKPLQSFSDVWTMSSPAPEMVVMPYGQFEMGAPLSQPSAKPAEKPEHLVTFKRGFAIAKNEISVGQFRQFIESSGYKTRASTGGWSMIFDEKGGSMTRRDGIDWRHDHLGRVAKEDLPVVHVNLYDAQAYAKWLSEKTGAHYRVPSEAEFEYVQRAGKDVIYAWGNGTPGKVVANLAGAGDKSTQNRSWGNAIEGYRDFYWGAAPVRSFPREGWGTFDITGNVEEWVQDCWHDSYQRAPDDSSAWVNPGCKMGVTRGASWASSLEEARVVSRVSTPMKTHNARIGFRVVREL